MTVCLTCCSEKVVQFPGAELRLVIFSKIVLDPFSAPTGIPHGHWCYAQKLWRLSPSECPRITRCWVDMVCCSQHWLWFQKVSFNAVAPLRLAVKTVISIVTVVRRFPLCPRVSFQYVRIVIHLVLFRKCDRHYLLIREVR